MQAVNVRMRVAAIEDTEAVFIPAQTACAGHIAGEEDRHRQLQVVKQQFLQCVQFSHPFEGKCPAGRQRFIGNFAAHTLDDIGCLLKV
ncbi:hypothetical protein D3C80_1913640 [compost metagenome]